MSTIRVYEDSGGGLYMTDGATYAGDFEHQEDAGGLVADIVSYDDWVSDASDNGDFAAIEGTIDDDSTNCIAKWDGHNLVISTDKMGAAGFRYAGIDSIYIN